MARELLDAAKELVLDADEMATVELMLKMGDGYVLDFNDRAFNEFMRRHWAIDVTAPLYTELGTSKANRLRGLLKAFNNSARAEVLQKFLEYRNHPSRVDGFEPVSDGVTKAYLDIIRRLEGAPPPVDPADWTGRPSIQSRVEVVKIIAPFVRDELAALIEQVEVARFNDPDTADALESLRKLHRAIGELIAAIEQQKPLVGIFATIDRHRGKLIEAGKRGAKIFAIAPAMTVGVASMLAMLTGTTLDTTMVSAVYATLMGAEALGGMGKGERRDRE